MISAEKKIGLALSGGGVRAVAFHAGVLRRFAELEVLENIVHISSVSGGSLFTGLVFHSSDYLWPTSQQYSKFVLPKIRTLLTSESLQRDAFIRLLLRPTNWCFLLSRSNVVAQSIERMWGISATIGQLPERPVWSINGTTAENGRRFRFKGVKIGDYEIGYADAEGFKLAEAMAVSASFPGGIGPLALDTTQFVWRKRESWGSAQPADVVTPLFDKLHLYDGGVYDNLGLEPLFNVGKQEMKYDEGAAIDFLVVSDAGAPYLRATIPGPLNPGRLKRVADVAFDQARALRVRAFVNFLQANPASGMYLQIGSDPLRLIKQYSRKPEMVEKLQKAHQWSAADDVASAVAYKTTLCRMRENDFDLLARHGYETALWNELIFLPTGNP